MNIKPFESKIWLSSPTMHDGEEMKFVKQAYDTNWMSTVGENIDAIERDICAKLGCKYAVALGTGTAVLHLCMKLAAQKVYGMPKSGELSLAGKKVFCSDLTFDATVNPVVYEGGTPVFIDSERDTWNMDPQALEKAFDLYPEVKIVVLVHLYGTPAKIEQIRKICDAHGAVIVEDAAESLGATYNGQQTGTFGDFNCISFNGNKIITGSAGGMFLTDDEQAFEKVKKWSTQSREAAPWYQHEELGYNYRISNVIAGVIRGQIPHLDEHISQKRAVYQRYAQGLKDLPIRMNPHAECSNPNYWLSCLLIDDDAMCKQVRSDSEALHTTEAGKSCPTQIFEQLAKYNIESRPIWKPMHIQPYFYGNPFITKHGNGRANTNAYRDTCSADVGSDIFARGLCLPSDNKMTPDQQDVVIQIIKDCFL